MLMISACDWMNKFIWLAWNLNFFKFPSKKIYNEINVKFFINFERNIETCLKLQNKNSIIFDYFFLWIKKKKNTGKFFCCFHISFVFFIFIFIHSIFSPVNEYSIQCFYLDNKQVFFSLSHLLSRTCIHFFFIDTLTHWWWWRRHWWWKKGHLCSAQIYQDIWNGNWNHFSFSQFI